MSAIQDISGEVLRVEEGSLCPALHGWRKPVDSCGMGHQDTGRRARLYGLTAL